MKEEADYWRTDASVEAKKSKIKPEDEVNDLRIPVPKK